MKTAEKLYDKYAEENHQHFGLDRKQFTSALTEHDAELLKWAEENSEHANNLCLDNSMDEREGKPTDYMVIRISELKQKLEQK